MKKPKQMALGDGAPPVALVEYKVSGIPWRCNHFDQLAAEVGLTHIDQLPLFHDQASTNERPWMIVRRLFGIQPVLPSASYNLDDLREWERKELCEALGITRAQIAEELAVVRGAWDKIKPQEKPKVEEKKSEAPADELHFPEEEVFKKYGFKAKMGLDMEQRAWFAGRIQDYAKLLNEPVTAGLAHNALMTELQTRQFDDYFSDPLNNRIGTNDWRANLKARQDMDKTYREQTDQILKQAPWASAIAGKYAFAGVLSDITKAIQDYQGRGDTRLVDGMFTAMEIRIEMRRSVQTPAPRYRASLPVHVSSAKAGLWDPNWESPFTNPELKRLDKAWTETMTAALREDAVPLPDLVKEGPEGEYEELRKEEVKP